MKNRMKETKGITLIALVITIIVLILLAGVTIATLTGDNGILGQAYKAKESTINSSFEEMMKLVVSELHTEFLTKEWINNEASDIKEWATVKMLRGKLESQGYNIDIPVTGDDDKLIDKNFIKIYKNDDETNSFYVQIISNSTTDLELKVLDEKLIEYEELEYIKTSGTQNINTGFQVNLYDDSEFRIKFSTDRTGIDEVVCSFEGGYRSQVPFTPEGIRRDICTPYPENRPWSVTGWFTNGVTSNRVYEFYVKNGVAGIVDFDSTSQSVGENKNGILKIGGCASSVKIYKCRYTRGGEDIFSLIPVRNISTGICGMFDLISGGFYVDENNGNFVAGPTL